MSNNKNKTENKRIRCEGWHRSGGAFTFGRPQWIQCENEAQVIIIGTQDGGESFEYPACIPCWQTAIDYPTVHVTEAKPLKGDENVEDNA